MDKRQKILIIVVATFVLIVLLSVIYMKGFDVSASIVPTTRRTCDFIELDSTLYAFCDDGSEFRIADQVTQDPKGQ